MIRFIVLGLVQGAVFGLLALGIVIVYKGSRVFNFAQAEFGTLASFFLYFFLVVAHLPYALAILVAL
ncbi:MAG: branched-chain amino acid ABC transporter permease, partial [Actinomycetota bacterium]